MTQKCWSLLLPLFALAWFCIGSNSAFRFNRQIDHGCPARYFYWGSIRLDSDPLERHPISKTVIPCKNGEKDCFCWGEPVVWIDPGWDEKAFVVSALPALLLTKLAKEAFARFGISSVITFFVSMPLFLSAWFYLIGWWIDDTGRSARSNLRTITNFTRASEPTLSWDQFDK